MNRASHKDTVYAARIDENLECGGSRVAIEGLPGHKTCQVLLRPMRALKSQMHRAERAIQQEVWRDIVRTPQNFHSIRYASRRSLAQTRSRAAPKDSFPRTRPSNYPLHIPTVQFEGLARVWFIRRSPGNERWVASLIHILSKRTLEPRQAKRRVGSCGARGLSRSGRLSIGVPEFPRTNLARWWSKPEIPDDVGGSWTTGRLE